MSLLGEIVMKSDIQGKFSALDASASFVASSDWLPPAFLVKRAFARIAMASATAAVLSACGANHYSIYRYQPVTEQASITSVDAKQRVVLTSNVTSHIGSEPTPGAAPAVAAGSTAIPAKPEQQLAVKPSKASVDSTSSRASTQTFRRFCAEPSPDVFAVLAQSLAVGASFGQTADPKAVEAALNTAFGSSEQASTIPRTQTMNMLRELMYRTCERYLSGGISDLELPLQAIRDQRLMVSILAIEQLTGAVTPKPVTINVLADASSGSSGAEATVRIDEANKALNSKIEQVKTRQKEFDELNTPADDGAKDCDAIDKAITDKKEDELSQDRKDKMDKCKTAKANLKTAKDEQAKTSEHYANLAKAAGSGGIPVSTKTSVGGVNAEGGIDRAHDADISDVTQAVKDIVEFNFDQPEFLFLCIKLLSQNIRTDLSAVEDSCIKYVNSGIELLETKNQEAIDASKSRILKTTSTLFDKFWNRVKGANNNADTNKMSPLLANLDEGEKQCFAKGTSEETYRSCFSRLRRPTKDKLAGEEN